MLLSTVAIIVGLIAAMGVVVVVVMISKSDYIAWDRGKLGMPRLLKETEVRTDDLPALVEAMSRGTASVRYAALIFSTPDRPSDEDALNLQVSFENGKAGFDWVLLAPRNIEDKGNSGCSPVSTVSRRLPCQRTGFRISGSSVQMSRNSPPALRRKCTTTLGMSRSGLFMKGSSGRKADLSQNTRR
jgi:hypothetical protein